MLKMARKTPCFFIIVLTWRTRTFASDLLCSYVGFISHVGLGSGHERQVWILLAVRSFAL